MPCGVIKTWDEFPTINRFRNLVVPSDNCEPSWCWCDYEGLEASYLDIALLSPKHLNTLKCLNPGVKSSQRDSF